MITIDTTAKSRLQHQLKQQSSIIENILGRWQLPAIISGGAVEPDWIYFNFHRAPFPLLGTIDTDALCRALQAALGTETRWTRSGPSLSLAVRRTPDIPVALLDMLAVAPYEVLYESCLGLSESGESLAWGLTNPQSGHIIATGAPGAGLIDLLHTQAMSLALGHTPDQLRFLLLDGSDQVASPLARLLDLPHTTRLAAGAEAVDLLIRLGHRLLTGSDRPVKPPQNNMLGPKKNGNGRYPPLPVPYAPNPTPRLVIICHRLDRLLARQPKLTRLLPLLLNPSVLSTPSTGSGQVPSTGSGQAPFNLLATVRPPAFGQWPVLGQFPLRLVGCMPDTTSAAQATGRPYSQAERLLGGGDFLAIAAGVFVHFQAASLAPYEWEYCLGQIEIEIEIEGRDRDRGVFAASLVVKG